MATRMNFRDDGHLILFVSAGHHGCSHAKHGVFRFTRQIPEIIVRNGLGAPEPRIE